MEFKVGKWYRKKDTNVFIKFLRSEIVMGGVYSYNKVYYSERIDNGKHSYVTDYWASKELEKFALNNPCTIEEVQQYLPEGHEDKIKRSIFNGLIEGNYYRIDFPYKVHVIGICLRNDSDMARHSMCPENRVYGSMTTHNSDALKITPATPEEKEHLNDCIAAGKYVDKPEKWIPKVGEWVVYEKHICGDFLGKMFYQIGEVFQIKEVVGNCNAQPNSYWIMKKPDKETCHLACRKALPHEIPKQEKKEPTDDICKRCASIYYEGSVNTNQWNLCEGTHCQDMLDLEEENQTSNNLTPNKNEHTTYKGKAIEVRPINRTISTGVRRSGTTVQSRIIEVQIGAGYKRN